MYTLTVHLSGKTVAKHEFSAKPRVVVGRSRECDIVIDNLGVSRTHCEIISDGHHHVVNDLGSNNGVYVHGKRVWSYNLNDGDEFSIGKFTLVYERGEAVEAAPVPPLGNPAANNGGKRDMGDFTMPIDARHLGTLERAHHLPKGHLVVIGARKKLVVPLEKAIFVIGKADGADLKVGGLLTRRKHALIIRDEVGFHIVDTSGKYKTYVNDSPVDMERLKDGDVIEVAGQKFQFMVGSPSY